MNSLDLRTYRRFLSVVPRESILFDGTVRENVACGMDDADEETVRAALRDANALEFRRPAAPGPRHPRRGARRPAVRRPAPRHRLRRGTAAPRRALHGPAQRAGGLTPPPSGAARGTPSPPHRRDRPGAHVFGQLPPHGHRGECFRQVGAYAAETRKGRFVLVPDPKVVRQLLTTYASLRIAQAERHSPTAARELEDVSYTLCVMMATSRIDEAIARADALLVRPVPGSTPGRTPEADGGTGLSLAV
ncbi:hypothetical protein GCM10010261_36950 [Streptomyces pilosus]|nr:hypothetical protein GCM10010261_36950 [Streptomyces pilosus]